MKPLTNYPAIIVDLDGTLYYQTPVRIAMMKEMVLHFWRFRDFLMIQKYRKLYKQGYSETERKAFLPAATSQVVHEWMLKRPLPFVAKYRDDVLITQLEQVMKSGIIVIVYSDYPVKEKLEALRFLPDQAYSAEDLGCMKPNAEGLIRILAEQHIDPKACLVIGDRKDKDGVLGSNMSAEVLILPASRKKRADIYKKFSFSEKTHEAGYF